MCEFHHNDVVKDIINCQWDFFRNFYDFFHKNIDVQTFKIDFLEITKTGCGTVWFSWREITSAISGTISRSLIRSCDLLNTILEISA